MEELVRTNDIVLLSFLEALLKEGGFHPAIFDQNMSVMEGSIGILPRRLLVPIDEIDGARRLLRESGMDKELAPPPRRT